MNEIQAQEKKVTKDMTIGDVVGKYPELAPIITANGLHCIGCHASTWETLEDGFMTHGMSEEQVDKIIDELNDFLSNKKEEEEFSDEVTLTDAAVNKVKSLMKAENKEGFALRIGVVSGGCSGMSYELSFVGKAEKNDLHREKNGLKIYLEKDSIEYMGGATIDFVDSLQDSGFKINNPRAKSGCGCGKSFN